MLNRRMPAGALAGAAAVAAQSPTRSPKRKPNFLFLIADDHAGYAMGAQGDPLAQTPNLDRLASEGTRFQNHFCNSPVCTPSRQSFFTGLYPYAAGVTRLQTPLSEEKATLARQFQQAGYRTGVLGKMHFNRAGRPGLHGFDDCITEDVLRQRWVKEVNPRAVDGVKTKPQWRPFRDPARIWLNAEKLPFPRHDADMKGTFQVKLAGQFLEQNRDKPFALWVSFHEPHSPYDFPIEDANRFDPRRFPVPRVGPEDAWQIPLIFRDLTSEEKQGIAAAYYTSAYHLDRNIGLVLAKLRELNLEDDTLVVYLADHGYCLGQHGRFEKHCGYDPAMRVPLLIRYPGRVRQGVVRDLTEHIDVTPTILDLMSLPPLPGMHGHSMRPYLEGKRAEKRDAIFSIYLENEEAFLRTERWKYIHCSGRRKRTDGYETDKPTPGRYVRLYDLKADPGEFTDVAAKNPRVVAEMQTGLLGRFRKTHPEASSEPGNLSREDALEWYLKPRDTAGAGGAPA